jgi:hypothetical protein
MSLVLPLLHLPYVVKEKCHQGSLNICRGKSNGQWLTSTGCSLHLKTGLLVLGSHGERIMKLAAEEVFAAQLGDPIYNDAVETVCFVVMSTVPLFWYCFMGN